MKRLALTKGKETLIDDADFTIQNRWKWSLSAYGFAARNQRIGGKTSSRYLHRDLLGAKTGQFVGHINGDRLDNRRKNLRFCTKSQNLMNRGKTCRNKIGFKGLDKTQDGFFKVRITANRKSFYLGYFRDGIAAAKAYDRAARKLHGKFAKTNF